jgi:F-type H+-transporting ATPase subunit delta
MAEITTIARPYAEALARLARESNAWDSWSGALSALSAIATDPQLADYAANPSVPAEKVAELMASVAGDKLSAEGRNLLAVLAENKRFSMLPEIARLFEEMKTAQEGIVDARVATAYELAADQLAAIVAKLELKLGKKVTASQTVDSELIGGVVIQVGDEVLDASVRGRIKDLAVTLKS